MTLSSSDNAPRINQRLRERIDALPSVHIPQPSDDMKGFMEENKQWQADLLDAIYQKNLQVNNTNHIAMVSTQLDESARLQTEASFHRMILKHLDFPDRPEREDRICEAHQNTFDWIFHTASKGSKPWASFVDWLETDDCSNIYWITGKAGSGKSTLMKYLYHDPRTMEYLKTWVGGSPLLTAGFYFWNSGTVMQMSRMGLVQSLLHQILKQRPQLTTKLFADRYETYSPLGGRLPNWTWAELSRAFHILTSDESLRLFLLIDGLDEFDGDHSELVDMIVGLPDYHMSRSALQVVPGWYLKMRLRTDQTFYSSNSPTTILNSTSPLNSMKTDATPILKLGSQSTPPTS